MTRVYVEMAGGRYALTAKGHAAGSEQGCAFISGILYALAGYLVNAEADGYARVDSVRLNPGDVNIQAQGGMHVGTAFKMAVIGLRQLEKQHPELVRIEISEKLKKFFDFGAKK